MYSQKFNGKESSILHGMIGDTFTSKKINIEVLF